MNSPIPKINAFCNELNKLMMFFDKPGEEEKRPSQKLESSTESTEIEIEEEEKYEIEIEEEKKVEVKKRKNIQKRRIHIKNHGHGYLQDKAHDQIFTSYEDAFIVGEKMFLKNPKKCGGITHIGPFQFELRIGKHILTSPCGEYSYVFGKVRKTSYKIVK